MPLLDRALQLVRGSLRLWLFVAVPLSVAGCLGGYYWSERAGVERLLAVSSERLELYAGMLESEIGRYAQMPRLVAIDAEATAVLADPQQPALRALSSRRLARMAARSGVRALWVVNARGERLAGSEGSAEARATSPVLAPERLARELAAGVQGFFATAPDGSSTDYFVVHSIPHDGRTAGFVVARIALAPLEATWIDLGARTQSERVLVVDERQRVLLSSVPDWKLRTLAGSANAVNGGRLESPVRPVEAPGPSSGGGALTLQAWQTLSPGAQIVDAGIAGTPWRCLAQDSPVPGLGVRVLALSDTAETWRRARWSALGGGAAGAFVGLLWIYLRYRQRSLAQMARARDDLRRARDELERQVLERTRQLSEANGELQRQVAERAKVQDELVQAGKLAVLGQMSAEVSHEINQPLTALRALAGNTERLLKMGRPDAVTANLRAIGGLLERMERTARQLKSFARKGSVAPQPVRVRDAVDNARALLSHRLQAERVALHVDVDGELRLLCVASRLEQVLVNLLSNAIDAVANGSDRRIRIAAELRDGRCHLSVADSGGAVDEAVLERVFEPFFTTKAAGEGLGLGLVISQNIVQEFGGALRVARDAEGLVFSFDLPMPREA